MEFGLLFEREKHTEDMLKSWSSPKMIGAKVRIEKAPLGLLFNFFCLLLMCLFLWYYRLKHRMICMSGRLHLRMLCHKHQVQVLWWGKMVSSGMIGLIQLIILRTSVCPCCHHAFHLLFNFTLCFLCLCFALFLSW